MPTPTFTGGFTEFIGKGADAPTREFLDLDNADFVGTRTFKGPWANRFDFIFADIMIPSFNVGESITYARPARYPDYKIAYASQINIEGRGSATVGDEGQAVWDRAEITVTYKTGEFQRPEDPEQDDEEAFNNSVYLEESIDSSIDILPLPGENIIRTDTGKRIKDEGVFSRVTPRLDILLKQKYIINVKWTTLATYIGTVNKFEFTFPSGFKAGEEELLYMGPSGFTKVDVFSGGGLINDVPVPLPIWEMEHRFSYRTPHWNKAWLPSVLDYVEVQGAENDRSIYQLKDHRDIFFSNPET